MAGGFLSALGSIDGAGLRARVQNAIASASGKTGVDFSYLYAQAKLESGLNPKAQARTSSASGLYQFIEQSWLGVVKQHGDEHGLGWAASAITRGRDGRYHVSDAATRQAILGLRQDPETAATMAAEHAADNKTILESKLGRSVGAVDLYMAHFLGSAGATKFLRGLDADPGAAAADVLPAAARANRTIFYNRDGSARSFAEIEQRFAKRFDGGNGPTPIPATALPNVQLASATTSADDSGFLSAAAALGANSASTILSPSPKTARLAYLMLSSMGV